MVARKPQVAGTWTGRERQEGCPYLPVADRQEREHEAAVVPVHEGSRSLPRRGGSGRSRSRGRLDDGSLWSNARFDQRHFERERRHEVTFHVHRGERFENMHKVVERQTFSQLPKLDLDFIIEAERGLDGRLDEKGTPEVVHDHPVELLEVDSLRRHLVDDGQPSFVSFFRA